MRDYTNIKVVVGNNGTDLYDVVGVDETSGTVTLRPRGRDDAPSFRIRKDSLGYGPAPSRPCGAGCGQTVYGVELECQACLASAKIVYEVDAWGGRDHYWQGWFVSLDVLVEAMMLDDEQAADLRAAVLGRAESWEVEDEWAGVTVMIHRR